MKSDKGEISDGYHTFNELYQHRNALFLAFLKYHGGWASRVHSDGSSYDGYFIAGTTVNGKHISYHLPDDLWEYVVNMGTVIIRTEPPYYDGYTSNVVVKRLLDYVRY